MSVRRDSGAKAEKSEKRAKEKQKVALFQRGIGFFFLFCGRQACKKRSNSKI